MLGCPDWPWIQDLLDSASSVQGLQGSATMVNLAGPVTMLEHSWTGTGLLPWNSGLEFPIPGLCWSAKFTFFTSWDTLLGCPSPADFPLSFSRGLQSACFSLITYYAVWSSPQGTVSFSLGFLEYKVLSVTHFWLLLFRIHSSSKGLAYNLCLNIPAIQNACLSSFFLFLSSCLAGLGIDPWSFHRLRTHSSPELPAALVFTFFFC